MSEPLQADLGVSVSRFGACIVPSGSRLSSSIAAMGVSWPDNKRVKISTVAGYLFYSCNHCPLAACVSREPMIRVKYDMILYKGGCMHLIKISHPVLRMHVMACMCTACALHARRITGALPKKGRMYLIRRYMRLLTSSLTRKTRNSPIRTVYIYSSKPLVDIEIIDINRLNLVLYLCYSSCLLLRSSFTPCLRHYRYS